MIVSRCKNVVLFFPDVPCWRLTWDLIRNSTLAERLGCSAAVLLLLAVCAASTIYFTVYYEKAVPNPDPTPEKDWFKTRDSWLAEAYPQEDIPKEYQPVRLVIIQHSVSTQCYEFERCAIELRNLQYYFIHMIDSDIPYNFLVGNDGRIYEGRGWQKLGAHTFMFNSCALSIGFIGDYREGETYYARVTDLQENRTQRLFDVGVRQGYLHPNFKVVAAFNISHATESPGANLYKAMKKWPHFDNGPGVSYKTCDDLMALNLTNLS